jgi:vacuolar protein sorting-associated protein 1
MPSGLLGVGNLTNKLTKILFSHIKHSLPEIMKDIRIKMKETENDLKDLGPEICGGETEKQQLLWNMVTDFI